jgi:hypothetical protein
MSFTTAEAREELLDGLAQAIEHVGAALSLLGTAYEQLDEPTGDRLEEELFGPVQRAYGRSKTTYTQFADRHGMEARTFEAPPPGAPSTGAKGLIDSAVDATAEADRALAELQDLGPFAEVSDVELRSGISGVRELLGGVRGRARELERTLGR